MFNITLRVQYPLEIFASSTHLKHLLQLSVTRFCCSVTKLLFPNQSRVCSFLFLHHQHPGSSNQSLSWASELLFPEPQVTLSSPHFIHVTLLFKTLQWQMIIYKEVPTPFSATEELSLF